ncbi:hypothetical protein DKT69_15735 [Micromonospora sicca]|uniref:Uncharacterized protein n=1 Tax=Micromonospora sicca TaxID=2202420 RepID=A0A317DIV0_9ACTN|nr:hypothetical protein [Micromonospora sp. 4G51]PWR14578.1 hypothetical protein DKT69_15735 [Micromonospora sp. 4G51]
MSVAPGDLVQLSEPDYQYGTGPLRLRITRVRFDLSTWYDGRWVWLEGIEIRVDDQDGRLRQVLVRVSALPKPEA